MKYVTDSINIIKQNKLFLQKTYQLLSGAHSRLRFGEYHYENENNDILCKPCCVKEASLTRAKREDRSASAVSKLKHESKVLHMLKDHPNIVSSYGICEKYVDTNTSNNNDKNHKNKEDIFFQLIMQKCHGTTLSKAIANELLSLDMCIRWLYEIADAMNYVHSCNIIHRDLKPNNVVLNNISSAVKLIDFDASYILKKEDRINNELIGTLQYMSPEMLSGSDYGKPTDVYSYGILMYEIIERQNAYYGKINAMPDNDSMTRYDFKHAVINHNLRPTTLDEVNNNNNHEIYELMFQCWEKDEVNRPTFNDICFKLKNILVENFDNSSDSSISHHFSYGISSNIGRRKNMEDQLLCVVNNKTNSSLAAVFDGHGGSDISLYVKEKMHEYFIHNDNNPYQRNSLFDILSSIENDVQQKKNKLAQNQGTTASCIIVDYRYIQIANLGDSDIILCEKKCNDDVDNNNDRCYNIKVMSKKHAPDEKAEEERIMEYGGTIKRMVRIQDDGNEYPFGPSRIYVSKESKVGLAVSRAIGDLSFRPYISSVPSTKMIKRKHDKQLFIIIASDGIWDVLTHSEACEIVFKHLKEGNHTSSIDHHLVVNEAAEEIVNESLHKGTQDNVSCVVVNLHTQNI